MALNAVEIGTMIAGYERVINHARQEFYETMDGFPACADPRERRKEFLAYIDQMQFAGIDRSNLDRYRQLCNLVEDMYDLAISMASPIKPK